MLSVGKNLFYVFFVFRFKLWLFFSFLLSCHKIVNRNAEVICKFFHIF
nr:MAG TPA: hypothetical protein [Caudoviricetes sp.]